MKKPLLLGAAILFVAISVMAQSGSGNRSAEAELRDRFIGAWRLAWLEEQGADGKVHRVYCTGLLAYTRDGHMSVQVMYQNPRAESEAAPVQYAQGGYEASFGRYQVDDAHSFTYHVEGALVRALIGKDLKRAYEFSGNQLIVRSADPNEHWRVAWEHN